MVRTNGADEDALSFLLSSKYGLLHPPNADALDIVFGLDKAVDIFPGFNLGISGGLNCRLRGDAQQIGLFTTIASLFTDDSQESFKDVCNKILDGVLDSRRGEKRESL